MAVAPDLPPNHGTVVGLAFGRRVEIDGVGRVSERPVAHAERMRVLVDELGFSEEFAEALPADQPTPPPPGSRTAAARA
jgi:N-hydroxyarylamine O-acetyltransferase